MFFRRSANLAVRASTKPRVAHSSRRWNSSSTVPPPPSKSSKAPRRIAYTLSGGLGLVGGAWLDDEYNDRTVTRNLRTAYNGIMLAIDYKLNFDPESLASINALHERAAGRLLDVCEKNRGLYVKLAQALATQGPFLPAPYMKLAKLLDDAEHFEYDIVRDIIRKELGAPIEDLFIRFDEEPIAAASIAQVHRARIRLPSGEEEEVAVKVQRPDIRRHAKWDLWAYRSLLHIYSYFFDLPLSFAANYISDQLMQETQFDHEARNSETIRNFVLNSPDAIIRNTVYVPRIHEHLSTPRILTMEFIEHASKLTDMEKIDEKGLDKKKVGQSVAEVFAAQIFDFGFVQADGHPSNVLVRKHPNGKKGQHQIVLIDHGLYIPLSPTFRRQYSELWYAIFIADLSTVRRICAGWGIGQAELFASATLLKPWKASKPGSTPSVTGRDDRKHDELLVGVDADVALSKAGEAAKEKVDLTPEEMQKALEKRQLEMANEMKERIKTFLLDTELVPKELIFIGRAMRILQANNQAMGSPVNRLNILARHASSGLLRNPETTPTTVTTTGLSDSIFIPMPSSYSSSTVSSALQSYLTSRLSFLRFRTALFAIDLAFYLTNWTAWIRVTKRKISQRVWGSSGDGREEYRGKFEDVLEQSMKDMAMSKFGVKIGDDAFEG